ncbi:MAG: NAD(P)/FAD-dependent oxidoreductase [Candidatus Velthaea sp.]|jgi:NADH dehydrogenase
MRTTIAIGFACGIACAAVVWIFAHPFAWWVLLAGGAAGAAYAAAAPSSSAMLEEVVSAAALAIPLWAMLEVIVVPLAGGQPPAWTNVGMRALFPSLIGWIGFGCALGLMLHAVRKFAPLAAGSPNAAANRAPARIVILGGGFAGMTTAAKLERALGADRSVEITLVSDTNALLFTPMLAEVAGGSIEPTHISSPLRTSLRRTKVVRATVNRIDLDARMIDIESRDGTGLCRQISYDHLVLALGAVSNFFGEERIARVALDFKSLTDAIRIRNWIIALIERADLEPDTALRRALLTFVIAGGGFAGVELAGALNDFARGVVADYGSLSASDVSVVLVHARERILPELSPTLAKYAQSRMTERGVRFVLETRVTDASSTSVSLASMSRACAETIASYTLIWTAGTAPNPLLTTLDVPRDGRGAAFVNANLAVAERTNVWALGDCAAVPNGRNGTYPPTAQHALRQAACLASNIRATLRGEPLERFAFESLGSLCVIGHQLACAEIRVPFGGRKLLFSGVFAWLLWRAIYLSKLPGFDRKARVLVDWVTELLFPRDTVQTIDVA